MTDLITQPLWRKVFAPCRRGLYRLLYPRPSHTAPRWIIDTYCMSQGNIPSRSPIFNAILFDADEMQSNRAPGVVSSSSTLTSSASTGAHDSPTHTRFRARGTPFTGSLQEFEDRILHSTGAVLVLFHLHVWDATIRGQRRHRKGRRQDRSISGELNGSLVTNAKTEDREVTAAMGIQSTSLGSGSLSSEPERIACWSVNAATHTEIAALYDIRFLPTWLGYRDGRLIGRVEGGQDEHLLTLVEELQLPSRDEGTVLDCSSVCVEEKGESSSREKKPEG